MNLDYNYSCEYSVELVRKLECDDIAPLDDGGLIDKLNEENVQFMYIPVTP